MRDSKTREHTDAARCQHVRIACATVVYLLDRVFGQRERVATLFSWPGSHEAHGRQMAARFAAGLRSLDVPFCHPQGFTLGGLPAGGVAAFFEASGNDVQLAP